LLIREAQCLVDRFALVPAPRGMSLAPARARTGEGMSRIFLSHSSANNADAVGLRDWLAEEGWDDVFLDLDPERGIAGGERWERALNEAASRCEAVLLLVSRAWLDSEWCQKELSLAHKLDKRLFGVLIEKFEPAELPPDLSTWQVVDLASGRDHRQFRVTLPRTQQESHVTFSQEGLKRLRAGLVKAGLDPRFFAWPPETDPNRPPYRGLRPMEAEDAGIFFGRDAPIFEALDQLRGLREDAPPRLLVILGASGAGKSSFLRAGLFARMARYDRDFLPLQIIRPQRGAVSGETGLLGALEAALAAAQIGLTRTKLRAAIDGGAKTLRPVLQHLVDKKTPTSLDNETPTRPPTLVISIDQGEELFHSEGQDEAQALLTLLQELLTEDAPALIVVIAIRSDSYAQLQEAKPLEGVRKVPFDLGPMPHGSYAEVIKGPATRLEGSTRPVKIENALVGVLLRDIEAGRAKDALPLLSFTLERLYQENRGSGRLTVADYRNLGGIKGSIEEAVGQALMADTDPPIPRDRAARLALLRRAIIPWLADIDPDTGAPRRRVARLSEIPAECRPLLQNLVQQRLLTTDRVAKTGEVTIEPAHEALLRQWSLLGDWLAEDTDLLAVLDGVKSAARDWTKSGKSTAWLTHSEDRLTDAEQLRQRPDLAANLEPTDQAYLAACRSVEDKRSAAEKRQREAELEAAKKLAAAQTAAKEEAEARANEAQDYTAVLRKRSRILRVVLVVTVIIALVAVYELFSARQQRQDALQSAQKAIAQNLVSKAQAILAGASNTLCKEAKRGVGCQLGDDVQAFQELLAANKLKPDDGPLLDALFKRSSTDLILNMNNPVVGVAFAEGGHRLAVADSNSLRIWDTRSGTWRENLRHSDGVMKTGKATGDRAGCYRGCQVLAVNSKTLINVAISADGKWVAAGSDGTVQVWNLNYSQPAPKVLRRSHQGRVTGIALSRDGRLLASAGVDGVIEISKPNGDDMRFITTGGPILTLAFNRAADRLAAGGADGAIRIWNVGSVPPAGGNVPDAGEHLNAHVGGVMSVTFSPDDQLVASGGADNTVRLWDGGKLTPVGQLPAPEAQGPAPSGPGPWPWGGQGHTAPVTSVAFSTDGTRLVSGSNDKTVQLWDVSRRQRIGDPMIGHQGLVLSVAFVADGDGNEIVSGGNEHALRFWNAVVGQPPTEPLVGHDGPVTSVAISPDSRRIVSGGVDGTVQLWDTDTGMKITEMPTSQPAGVISRVAFNQAGDMVASGSADGKIRLWNLATGIVKPIDTGRPVTAIAMNRDGNRLASAGIDGQITIRELSSGRAIPLENRDHAIVFDVAFNPGGDRLASGGVAGKVRVWDLTGREVWEVDAASQHLAPGYPGEVLGVAFSPDGRRLASGSTEWKTGDANMSAVGVMQRWDADTGTPLGDPVAIGDAVMGLTFSSRSTDQLQDRIAAGSFDPYTVQLWSASAISGSQYTFTGHEAQVVSVAVSPDFTRIVSGSFDGTVRIWPNPSSKPPADALCAKLATIMSRDHWTDWVSPQIPYRELCPGIPPTPAEGPN
jgi:WD40 repeat protein